MPRTAPTVDGTGSFVTVSMRFIDAEGDKRAVSVQCDAAATDAEIEAVVAAIAAGSNANIYQVVVGTVYSSDADAQDATDAVVRSVWNNLVFTAKNATNDSRRIFLPAPEADEFVSGTEQIDPAAADVAAILTAWTALLETGFSIVSGRYTQRKETNPSIPI